MRRRLRLAGADREMRSEGGRTATPCFHDGPAGDSALLHGLPLQGTAQGAWCADGGVDHLLSRSRLLLKSWHQGRTGAAGCGGEVSAATAAAQDSEAAGGNAESLRADGEVFRFAAGCDSRAIPADAEDASSDGPVVSEVLLQARFEDCADGARSASSRY